MRKKGIDVKHCRELGRRCLGVKTHHDLSDELFEEVLKQVNECAPIEKVNADRDRDVHLSVCGGCNKQESCCGEYNRCQRCKNVYYCSRGEFKVYEFQPTLYFIY